MLSRTFLLLAALIGIGAFLYSATPSPQNSDEIPTHIGKNNTVLLLTLTEHGLSNVLVATGNALAVNHPDLDVHLSTFPKWEERISKISDFSVRQNPSARPLKFHALKGVSYADCFKSMPELHSVSTSVHPPGIAGTAYMSSNLPIYLMPWSGPDYYDLYQEIRSLLDDIDPAVVAIDPVFTPAIDAVRSQGRKYVIVSPNSLKEIVGVAQPKGSILWKYPAVGSGYPYPVPWHLIPSNIFLNLRIAKSIFMSPLLKEKKEYLKEKGLKNPTDFTTVCTGAHLCLTQALPGADYPLEVIPDNVKACGPIFVSTASAEEQDPELAQWLRRAPTILINLGSMLDLDERAATEMARALKTVLANTNTQVLWKLVRRDNYSDDFLSGLSDELKDGRIRVEKWLNTDPGALLESGNIVLYVHHGGAGCYFEAVAAGIPHVILAHWLDLYDFAVRAEFVGIGVWGNKRTPPLMFADELSSAILKPLADDDAAKSIRKKAKELGDEYRKNPGRIVAAQYIADLARLPAA